MGPLLVRRKGLDAFLRKIFCQLVKENNCHLHIVGTLPITATKQKNNELSLIKNSVQQLSLDRHVTFWGSLTDSELNFLMQQVDVHVFPLIDVPGDVEGFGMVVLEASAMGLATVTFDCGGVGDAVKDLVNGRLVASGDYDEFRQAIIQIIEETSVWHDGCLEYAKEYSWSRFIDEIGNALRK